MVPDRKAETVKEITAFTRPPISVKELLGGALPPQKKYDSKYNAEGAYERLSGVMLSPTLLSGPDGDEIRAIGPALRTRDLAYLLHFSAPSKRHGVDLEDKVNDWRNLFDDPAYAAKLTAHKKIPGWPEYEKHQEKLLELFERDQLTKSRPTDVVVPVIRLKKVGDNYSWVFEPVDPEDIEHTIFNSNSKDFVPVNSFMPILGPSVVAAYSPQITHEWGERRSYHEKVESTNLKSNTQDMGATQTLPLTIGFASTLFDTTYMRNLIFYAETGLRPSERAMTGFPQINEYLAEATVMLESFYEGRGYEPQKWQVDTATNVIKLLQDAGERPYLLGLTGEEVSDLGFMHDVPLTPKRYGGKAKWNAHIVCVLNGIVFDPIVGHPMPIDEYLKNTFEESVRVEPLLSDEDIEHHTRRKTLIGKN